MEVATVCYYSTRDNLRLLNRVNKGTTKPCGTVNVNKIFAMPCGPVPRAGEVGGAEREVVMIKIQLLFSVLDIGTHK
ncbi:hypothetical protein SETIT_8G208700v2 [Setaria italica]|uniref:Uncharacterized protein n=1 Tax=Setaria italica TaxID=4555 RepID=K3ZKR1_SETIT|nr:hypothetical protein SETIT_8G208700v2 [Setaria italica]